MASPTKIGRRAEAAAATLLRRQGFVILAQNWRTRWCEIDIVALKETSISFVEVKYRTQAAWGLGLEYITPKKRAQMILAAEHWVAKNEWSGDYCVAAIEVTGPQFRVTRWVSQVD